MMAGSVLAADQSSCCSLHRGRKCKPIFVQIARQVVKLNASDLRLPSRAWKVKLVGEGADDAGGVFDDTITEMCQVWSRCSRGAHGAAAHPPFVLAGVGDGRGRPAHPLPQRHGRGGLQPRQVRTTFQRTEAELSPSVRLLFIPLVAMLSGSSSTRPPAWTSTCSSSSSWAS